MLPVYRYLSERIAQVVGTACDQRPCASVVVQFRKRYNNKLIFFDQASKALNYLLQTTEQPFIILTDMNLPGINGLEFQKKIEDNAYLRKKCIPFIFFTTTNNNKVVEQAYEQHVQGFFQKPSNFNELAETLNAIVDYWSRCLHPNK